MLSYIYHEPFNIVCIFVDILVLCQCHVINKFVVLLLFHSAAYLQLSTTALCSATKSQSLELN